MNRLVADGLTAEEVDKGKRQVKGSIALGNESSSARMNRNGRNLLLLDEVEPIEQVIAKVERIERNEVNALIREVLSHRPAKAYVIPNEA
jgi:predicted Zn-dependent peptidase